MENNGQRILTKGHIACRTIIEDWIILFAAYTTPEPPNAFQRVGQPPKLTLPVG